jgi:Protein of unknown function (DUF2852)
MSCGYRAAMAGDGTTYQYERRPLFRSGWEVAAMVAGFIIFFPAGLAILGYFIWRKKMGEGTMTPAGVKGEWRRWKQEMKAQWKSSSEASGGFGMHRNSGNMAFDAYRAEVLRRLDEERRKLDDEQRAFNEFVLKLRRAKDQEEFDRFMADRNGGPASTAG